MDFLIGSDHVGFYLKKHLIKHLNINQKKIKDIGTFDDDRCDYYKIANQLTSEIIKGKTSFGVLICGTGIGMSIAANRKKGIRAVCCSDIYSARMSRKHNNSNVLCIGSRVIGFENAVEIFNEWSNTGFDGERHEERIKALDN
mgnify:CR=1 FL=1